ncbi:MAG: hypothetical protein ACE5GG_04100 [Candidatus Omnitrophota bacterium]
MPKINNRRRRFFSNSLQRELFFLVLAAAIIPAVIVGIGLYYLIFNIIAGEFMLPEIIAYNIIPAAKKVAFVLIVLAPLSILIISVIAHRASYRMVGPFDRILREMDEYIQGRRKSPIILRKKDKFQPLVERINKICNY